MRSVSASRVARSRPSRVASAASPSSTPSDGSSGVDGTFASVAPPSASIATRSVNVPPTSMPMRNMRLTLPHRRGRGFRNEPFLNIQTAVLIGALCGITPAAATTGFEDQAVARPYHQAGLLGADRARVLVAGIKHVVVRRAVFAAEDAAGAVHHPVAGGVGERRLLGLDDHLDNPAGAAAIPPIAARIGAELVALEEQRKAHLGHFEAAEFDATRRLPLAGAGPAVAGR